MKKLLNILLILCLLAVPVFAEEDVETSGICGEDMTWVYEEGLLTIEGSGLMDDFEEDAPWAAFKEEIVRVELKGDIEYIGAHAFTDYDNLSTVNFGKALYEIGPEAFMGCDGLTVIELPATFKIFGESSMNSCANLTAIHCSGKFPSFRMNSMWNTFCKIYYPAERPWGVQYIAQLEEAFKGRVEFLASDGTDHYNPVEEEPVTEAPTEAPTVPPTEAPTVAPTEPPVTVPPVLPTEAPVVIVPTQAPTEAPTEAPETIPVPAPEEKSESKSWIGLLIVGAVLGFVLLGTIATAITKLRRGRFTKRRRRR